jgi:hypothetical protein
MVLILHLLFHKSSFPSLLIKSVFLRLASFSIFFTHSAERDFSYYILFRPNDITNQDEALIDGAKKEFGDWERHDCCTYRRCFNGGCALSGGPACTVT